MHLFGKLQTVALVAMGMALVGGQAKADVYCPNAAAQGGFSNTFTSFAGSLDGTCGTNSGVQMSIATNTDYAKLTWSPVGVSLGSFADASANVEFTSFNPTDGPYYELAFVDPGCNLGQCTGSGAATDQILLIGFGDTSLTQATPGQITSLDPNSTILHLYDNTTGTDLEGGEAGAMTLSQWLSGALAPDYTASVTDFRIATGLAAGACPNCSETLAVDSMQLDSTPEPGTFFLLGGAIVAIAVVRRKKALPVA